MPKNSVAKTAKKADQYNDPKHNYRDYWHGRDYEHRAEELAIKRLLKGRHFKTAVDVGGGYGRLDPMLTEFADHVTLTEPSQQQLDMAKDFLKNYPYVQFKLGQADDLDFKTGSVDLVTLIRVIHHLPDPKVEFGEIARVLSPDGLAIIEVANYMHFRNRIKHVVKRQKFAAEPVDIRSPEHRNDSEIAFVNHNPKTVIKHLSAAGLKVERILSVSNLRSPGLKKLVPTAVMLTIEGLLQPTLAKTFFGPSIFFLVRKAAK